MKFFFTSTLAIGAICLIETTQPAKAIFSESIVPHIQLARGGGGHAGGHYGGRGFEGRGGEEHGAEDLGGDHAASSDINAEHSTALQQEDRSHTLENSNINRNNNLRDNAEGWQGVGGDWEGVDGGISVCPDGTMPVNGTCS